MNCMHSKRNLHIVSENLLPGGYFKWQPAKGALHKDKLRVERLTADRYRTEVVVDRLVLLLHNRESYILCMLVGYRDGIGYGIRRV